MPFGRSSLTCLKLLYSSRISDLVNLVSRTISSRLLGTLRTSTKKGIDASLSFSIETQRSRTCVNNISTFAQSHYRFLVPDRVGRRTKIDEEKATCRNPWLVIFSRSSSINNRCATFSSVLTTQRQAISCQYRTVSRTREPAARCFDTIERDSFFVTV